MSFSKIRIEAVETTSKMPEAGDKSYVQKHVAASVTQHVITLIGAENDELLASGILLTSGNMASLGSLTLHGAGLKDSADTHAKYLNDLIETAHTVLSDMNCIDDGSDSSLISALTCIVPTALVESISAYTDAETIDGLWLDMNSIRFSPDQKTLDGTWMRIEL